MNRDSSRFFNLNLQMTHGKLPFVTGGRKTFISIPEMSENTKFNCIPLENGLMRQVFKSKNNTSIWYSSTWESP